jgi:phage tail-like protein
MARPAATDFIHSMRFQVEVFSQNDAGYLTGLPGYQVEGMAIPQAGFTTCSIPELSIESVEYKEGTFVYPRKYPGNPSVSDCSFARGVAREDSTFWKWARNSVEGSGGGVEYRLDLQIKHYHRDQILPGQQQGGVAILENVTPGKVYRLWECFPIRCKPAGDLDATSSEISIQEMDVAVERLEVSHTGDNFIIP